MLLQTILLHGFRAIALLFALASRARILPHVKNEEHAMSIHTIKAAVPVSNGMDFRVTDVLRPQQGWDEFPLWVAASGVNPPDGAAADARHAPPAILVRQEWSAGHRRRCQVTAKDMAR
jgi:hypothetical protein